MRKPSAGLVSLALAVGLGASFGSPADSATPPAPPTVVPDTQAVGGHETPNPLEDKRRALREEALTRLLDGDGAAMRRGPSTVMRLGRAKTAAAVDRRGRRTPAGSEAEYVELGRETTDRIFVVLAEFGDKRHPDFPDKDLEPDIEGPATFDGPLHNAIPKPDRSVDNSTVWQPNYNRAHFGNLYFGQGDAAGSGGDVESVRQYYERQSSGRYSVEGDVTAWVKVKYNEARYGRSSDDPGNGDDPAVCEFAVCANSWNLVEDAVNQWVKDRKERGRTKAQIRAELATFDVWDRYDYDGDGDFNESDGYLDHFQIVHSGGDEASGDPQQGEDAIWSHRSYAFNTSYGLTGPDGNLGGGAEVGNTGLWVGDYTMQPENGGMSVFAHEFGHDLGLPDLYDTSGGGQNSVNFWSIMDQDRVSAPRDQGIGTRAADFGAWEKFQLGWLDYEIVRGDEHRRLTLGPHEYQSQDPQAAIVVLPQKAVSHPLVEPFAGSKSWWGGSGDDLDHTMSRDVTLADGPATLSMKARWDIEDCGPDPCDYAYVEVDDGSGWAAVPGSITQADEGNGIDGTQDSWTPAEFDLSAYAGTSVGLRLRYLTDSSVAGMGFFADDITLSAGGSTVFESGAESGDQPGDEGWTLDEFGAAGSSYDLHYDNYYIASHRDHVSFDRYLESGPYNFGFRDTRPSWAEHFPYQDGLLISYWDTSQADNNTSEHPGEGEILPVDANPRPMVRNDGQFWRPLVSGYDAPFSREDSDSFTLHVNGQREHIRGRAAQPTFRDDASYWYDETPTAGVQVPDNGVNVRVRRQEGTSMDIRIWNRR